MALLRNDENYSFALLTEPPSEAVKSKGLARAGGAADPNIAVSVLIVVVRVEERRRAIVHIKTEKYTVAVRKLIRGKWERRSDAACKRVSAALAL